MTITIGNTDITPLIKDGGLTFSRNDVEAPDAGRDLSGLMHRGRVAIKERIDATTILLTKTQVAALMTLIEPESFSVTVNPYPRTNAPKTMTMYSNNIKLTYVAGDMESITFPLIEM